MKSGHYAITFDIAGCQGEGSLDFAGRYGAGRTGDNEIELQFTDLTETAAGVISVRRTTSAAQETGLPWSYAVRMYGTSDDGGFDLLGTGPNGAIVGLSGRYASEFAATRRWLSSPVG